MNINSKEDIEAAINLGFDWAIVVKNICPRQGDVDSLFYVKADADVVMKNLDKIYNKGAFEAVKLDDIYRTF